ncbi:MAG: glycosyltransferase family 4 protein [Deferrisomatales bacterium]
MRVLHLDTGRSWRGGQQQVFYLHRGLLGRGVESHLICSAGGELLARAQAAGLPAAGLPLRGEWDLASVLRVAVAARRLGATVVHAHSAHALTIALLAARLGRGCRVVATRRVDFVPSRHPLNRWKYGGPHRLVAISRAIRQILEEFGVPPERLRLVPSGVDFSRVAPGSGQGFRDELGVGADERLVGNIAHLADHKGQRYFIEAMPAVLAAFPNTRFVIVGEGELEADLKARARALGLGERLRFPGFRRDVDAVMDALDLFVMPSHLEGLGTIVLDALASGKPVVAAAAGGIPEILEDGRHGLLVPPRDPAALARAIGRVLGDPGLACDLAAAGLGRARREFSVEAMVEGNLAVYRELGP